VFVSQQLSEGFIYATYCCSGRCTPFPSGRADRRGGGVLFHECVVAKRVDGLILCNACSVDTPDVAIH